MEILELKKKKQIQILGVFREKIDPSIDPAGASKRSTYYETNSYEQEELSLLYVSSETLTTNLYFEVQNLFLLWTLRSRPSRWTNDMFHLPKPPSWHFHIGSLDRVHSPEIVRETHYVQMKLSFPPRPNSDIDWLQRAWFVKLEQGVPQQIVERVEPLPFRRSVLDLESNIFSECCDYVYKIRENSTSSPVQKWVFLARVPPIYKLDNWKRALVRRKTRNPTNWVWSENEWKRLALDMARTRCRPSSTLI